MKILVLLSFCLLLSSCYKYKETNPLAVPPMFQEQYKELTTKTEK